MTLRLGSTRERRAHSRAIRYTQGTLLSDFDFMRFCLDLYCTAEELLALKGSDRGFGESESKH